MTKQHFILAGATLVLVGVLGMNYYQQQLTGQLVSGQIQVLGQDTLVVEEPGDVLDPNEVVATVENEDGTTTEYTRAQLAEMTIEDDVWIDADTEVEEPGDTTLISDKTLICLNVVKTVKIKTATGKTPPKEFSQTTTKTIKNPTPPPPTKKVSTTVKRNIAARCTEALAKFVALEEAKKNFLTTCSSQPAPGPCKPDECVSSTGIGYRAADNLDVTYTPYNVRREDAIFMGCPDNKAYGFTAEIKDGECTMTRFCRDPSRDR